MPPPGTTASSAERTAPADDRELRVQPELGERWSAERLEAVLDGAAEVRDPARRLLHLAELFLRESTPFEDEGSLPSPPDGAVRLRLRSFDCITFIYQLIALSAASSIESCARVLARIRYRGHPSERNLIRYAWSSVQRMIDLGLVRDATADILAPADLAVRSVRLGIRADGHPFLDVPGPGDPLLGREVSVPFIPAGRVREVQPQLRGGDILLLVSAKDPGEYPGIVAHAIVAYRKPGDPEIYVLHCGKSRYGSADGPPAGVRLLTYWDPERNALRDDGRHRPFHLYLEGSPHLWQGVVVLRPTAPAAGG